LEFNEKKCEYRIKYNLNPDSIVILFIGRFEHVKGIIEFANAVILNKYVPEEEKMNGR
jgi:glycosyltransferase involved in cell wall biosynthesis